MRKRLVENLLNYADDDRFVFLTGDLGYKALEPLRDAMKERFINVGVAEQNMVAMAAGLARSGMRPWCYSIAPFLYARAFEQIRNDVAQPRLPVMLVGNGAGFAYGVMGPSHHALNDYGILSTLSGLYTFAPCIEKDIGTQVSLMFEAAYPVYMRLGHVEEPPEFDFDYAPVRDVSRTARKGTSLVILVGSIAGGLLRPISDIDCNVYLISQIPFVIPHMLWEDAKDATVIVIEEHVQWGSVGMALATAFAGRIKHFRHLFASENYLAYGSKEFHRKRSGLDKDSVLEMIRECKNLS